jgi:hypothetical protein
MCGIISVTIESRTVWFWQDSYLESDNYMEMLKGKEAGAWSASSTRGIQD